MRPMSAIVAMAFGSCFVFAAMSGASEREDAPTAERHIFGFSSNGAYFAFQQFGFDETTGVPYASIFVLDTRSGRLAGPEVRDYIEMVTSDPVVAAAGLAEVRERVRQKAAFLLERTGTSPSAVQAGRAVATNPATEISRSVEFVLQVTFPLRATGLRLDLVEHPAPPPAHCVAGYAEYAMLDLLLTDMDATTRAVYRDTFLPEDRGCPVGYTFSDVIVFNAPDRRVVVVLLNSFEAGFEGPYRRFWPVAFDLPR